MSLGDVLDGAFKLFKANARTIVIVVAVIVLPLQFGTAFVLRDSYEVGVVDVFTDPSVIEASTETQGDAGQLVTILVSALLGILVTPFIAGAICRVVAASYLGNQIGPGDALLAAGRRFWPLLGSFILVHLIEGVALLLCIIPLLFVMPMYTLVAPAIVEENLGPIQGMSRSWGLVRRRYWPILGTSLLAGLIAYLLGSALGFVPSVLAAVFGGTFAWLLIAVGSLLSTIVSTPLVAIVATLLYFDARIRHEGFDLQVISRDLQARGY